jgi:hypothetical protein
MITSVRARIRCRGRLRGCPREGENSPNQGQLVVQAQRALLGPASEWVDERKCQALSQLVRARRAYRRGRGKRVRLMELRFELVMESEWFHVSDR